jgi:peptidoglycan LD-endopeptidase LytH
MRTTDRTSLLPVTILALPILLASFSCVTTGTAVRQDLPKTETKTNVCELWNTLYVDIRDGLIPEKDMKARTEYLHAKLQEEYAKSFGEPDYVFPVEGYRAVMPGNMGVEKSSYFPLGYTLYTCQKADGRHAAYDIFIRDKNQDCVDDLTGRTVPVLSFTPGIVTSVHTAWSPTTNAILRGGKYAWVYNPTLDRFYYYAHMSEIRVQQGEKIRAGRCIGIMGRTGLNAAMKESPTHLHFGCIAYSNARMIPVNTYDDLCASRTVTNTPPVTMTAETNGRKR